MYWHALIIEMCWQMEKSNEWLRKKHTCFKKKQRCVYTLTCNEICKEKFVGLSSQLFIEEIWSDWDSKGIFIFTPAVSCVVNTFHKYAHPAVLISGPMKVTQPMPVQRMKKCSTI